MIDGIEFGFVSSHKGGQHTNGPDYGVVTAEHALLGVKVEIQTSRSCRQHQARTLAATLIELAAVELR